MDDSKRMEEDSLGEVAVPTHAYYGAQTVRALELFPISGWRVHWQMIRSYMLIKKAAATANAELGQVPEEIADAISAAADEILSGKWRDQFPVDVFQMGAGTSFHMNVNEVLANRANELLGGRRGQYSPVHPNDHVNHGQSTNDTYPTAMRMASRFLLGDLIKVLEDLSIALRQRGTAFDSIIKAGRTHLQDAVPVRLGQEFTAYAGTVERATEGIQATLKGLELLGIGGGAVGTGLYTTAGYRQRVMACLHAWTRIGWREAPDLREAMQSQYPIARASSALRVLSYELVRITNDLRLLSSGPMTGLAEIVLPPVSSGSATVPGKMNPSMAEMLNMVCFQVIGNDTALGLAAQAGQLELNVMMPLMAFNILSSAEILKNACRVFTERCINGITANVARCHYYAERSRAIAIALTPRLGYEGASRLLERASSEGVSVGELAVKEGVLDSHELQHLLDIRSLTEAPKA